MRDDIRLGRIAGIPVGLSWGLLALAAYFTWSLSGQLTNARPGSETMTYWAYGLVGALLFCVSILVHEMGHALVAKRDGIPVEGITLWMLGGVAKLGRLPKTPGSEFRIAIAGPLGSALCALVFWALLQTNASPVTDGSTRTLLGLVLVWLSQINVILAVFNMLPGSPLDGGRVVAAGAWKATGSRLRGRLIASTLGVALGVAIIVWGVWRARTQDGSSELWTIMVGYFIAQSAWSERSALKHATAGPQPGQSTGRI